MPPWLINFATGYSRIKIILSILFWQFHQDLNGVTLEHFRRSRFPRRNSVGIFLTFCEEVTVIGFAKSCGVGCKFRKIIDWPVLNTSNVSRRESRPCEQDLIKSLFTRKKRLISFWNLLWLHVSLKNRPSSEMMGKRNQKVSYSLHVLFLDVECCTSGGSTQFHLFSALTDWI